MEKLLVNNYVLDEEQSRIAMSQDKYSIVVAGAGAGKTLTILGKIKYLLKHGLCKSEEIVCISFTREASSSLKSKIKDTCDVDVPVFTFHKLALEVLKHGKINYSICQNNLLEYIVDEFFESECFGNVILKKIVYFYFGYFWRTKNNWQKILNSKELIYFKKLITTFVSLVKNNPSNHLYSILSKHYKKYSILLPFYAIYLCYENEKKSTNSLDFDDMITEATNLLKAKNLSLPYKYVIIDEFQDTSEVRFSFIQEIIKQTEASLCVVGDDFQSIYHFSGCDLYLFLNFQKYYPDAKLYKILNTYRNSQELIDVAGTFVQRNPFQIPKELHSFKSIVQPIKIVYFKKSYKVLTSLLKRIGNHKSIFVLGRNNFNIKHYLPSYELNNQNKLVIRGFEDFDISYLTIHKSKGLESDVVIVLDVENSCYGIPSLIKDQEVLNLVKNSDSFLYEEERRLFYVALTRAREIVYLLAPKNNPSCFLKEIKMDKNVETLSLD